MIYETKDFDLVEELLRDHPTEQAFSIGRLALKTMLAKYRAMQGIDRDRVRWLNNELVMHGVIAADEENPEYSVSEVLHDRKRMALKLSTIRGLVDVKAEPESVLEAIRRVVMK
jgi:hypothetical protein